MVQGMLAVVVFCMFGFCFYIANKIDQFFDAIQETVKESKIINTLPGLKEIPGKLSHPGSFQAKLFHELEIFFPVGFSPVLRIIAHTGSDMVHF